MFKVPESKGSTAEGQFEFELAGTVYSIPKIEFLPVDKMLRVAHIESLGENVGMAEIGEILGLIGSLCDAPTGTLAVDQVMAIYQAWADESVVTPGESDSSATSSQSTEKKSNTPSSSTE